MAAPREGDSSREGGAVKGDVKGEPGFFSWTGIPRFSLQIGKIVVALGDGGGLGGDNYMIALIRQGHRS